MNALWALTDLVYIPLYRLTAIDFTVKLIVNGRWRCCSSLAAAEQRSFSMRRQGLEVLHTLTFPDFGRMPSPSSGRANEQRPECRAWLRANPFVTVLDGPRTDTCAPRGHV
jgi:hypothetical protein